MRPLISKMEPLSNPRSVRMRCSSAVVVPIKRLRVSIWPESWATTDWLFIWAAS